MTYNQSSYIADAMNGFAMQQTNFPFVAVIVDDASTDNEQEVIKSYVEEHFDHSETTGYREWGTEDARWFFARHKENENCHFVVVLLKRNLYKEPEKKETVIKEWTNTKYIALCEGDDYWTDPLKLQKQVGFLEEHEEYGFVGTNILLDIGGRLIKEKPVYSIGSVEDDFMLIGDVFEDAKVGPVARTVSLLFRREIFQPYEQFAFGDILIESILAKHSFFAFYQGYACVYRVGVGISSSKTDLNRALRYNDHIVNARRIQNQLFPADCHWSEDELEDRGTYLRLIYDIRKMKWRDALQNKNMLRSRLYKNKTYSHYLHGPFSCFALWIALRLKPHE